MKRRPWILVLLAVIHILAPIGNQIVNALFAYSPFWYYLKVAFQPHNVARHWFEYVAPVVAGISIYICRRWSFVVYLLTISALFIYSYFGYVERPTTRVAIELIVVYVLDVIVIAYFLLPAVRQVYFNPRLRWWETHRRYRADIKTNYSGLGGSYEGLIANASLGGLFIKSNHMPEDRTEIEIEFSYHGTDYQFLGTVVSHGQQDRMGFGVQLKHNRETIRLAKKFIRALHTSGNLLTEREPGPDDGFLSWVKTLVTTGRGALPEVKKK
ncbi:MAG: hypothetical protein BroJett040_08420 [Oligoflexia bacterium]|nr:MAG: hypothetical protein BroJett040_08420 [Oligoflexia bacterium]